MKNIIKKILKENEDEFEWAHDLNTDDVEKRVKSGFMYTVRPFTTVYSV